jgi:tyrosyl-DNA phosphodiesterase-1
MLQDWGNMTQAVWHSPKLPLRPYGVKPDSSTVPNDTSHPIGSGERFKSDLLRYFRAYGKRLTDMTKQLTDYDFSSVRAAFIGSTPSRQKPAEAKPSEQTSFGWLGLQEILSTIPTAAKLEQTALPPHIVLQVSSIATLGAVPTWLGHFQSVLARSTLLQPLAASPSTKSSKLSKLLGGSDASDGQKENTRHPKFNIIFPTPNEIRTSLDGYASGGSIHTKLQSQPQQKQLEYLHPLFCHWKPPSPAPNTTPAHKLGHALRGPAAPHIKTYIRFSSTLHKTIDWAMLTSANLSKQAWGDVVSKKNEIWIQSWEAGVVVWPDLFIEPDTNSTDTVMIPVFGKDMPDTEDVAESTLASGINDTETGKTVVGIRMPYDLPLSSHAPGDKPWCATMQYSEPDWKGLTWGGY